MLLRDGASGSPANEQSPDAKKRGASLRVRIWSCWASSYFVPYGAGSRKILALGR